MNDCKSYFIQVVASRDKELVKELGSLLDKTGKRENIISGITEKLQVELGLLTQFLDNVAGHRPKGKCCCCLY